MKELANGERQRGLHWATVRGEQGRDGQAFKSGEFWGVIMSCGFIDSQTKFNCTCIANGRGISWKAQCSILWNISRNLSMERVARHGKGLLRDVVEVEGRSERGNLLVNLLICPNCFPNFSSRVILAPLAGISHRRPILPMSPDFSWSFSSLKSQY